MVLNTVAVHTSRNVPVGLRAKSELKHLFNLTFSFVGETRYALSEETYVFPRAVGYSSCAVAFWDWKL